MSSASPLQFRNDSHESLKNSLLESDSAFIGEFLLAHEGCTNAPFSIVILFWTDYCCFRSCCGYSNCDLFFFLSDKLCHQYKCRSLWNCTAVNLHGSHLKSTTLLRALGCFMSFCEKASFCVMLFLGCRLAGELYSFIFISDKNQKWNKTENQPAQVS